MGRKKTGMPHVYGKQAWVMLNCRSYHQGCPRDGCLQVDLDAPYSTHSPSKENHDPARVKSKIQSLQTQQDELNSELIAIKFGETIVGESFSQQQYDEKKGKLQELSEKLAEIGKESRGQEDLAKLLGIDETTYTGGACWQPRQDWKEETHRD